MRIFGIAIVEVITSEPFRPFIKLYGIKKADDIAKYIEDMSSYYRKERGVRESDFHHF